MHFYKSKREARSLSAWVAMGDLLLAAVLRFIHSEWASFDDDLAIVFLAFSYMFLMRLSFATTPNDVHSRRSGMAQAALPFCV